MLTNEVIITQISLLLIIFITIVAMFVFQIIYYRRSKKKENTSKDVTFTHYIFYDEDDGKYVIKEFDDSITIVDTYYNTHNGSPLIIIQTQGWIPRKNSLGSKITYYGKTSYVITDEYIFQDEQSAILQAIKLNKIV